MIVNGVLNQKVINGLVKEYVLCVQRVNGKKTEYLCLNIKNGWSPQNCVCAVSGEKYDY